VLSKTIDGFVQLLCFPAHIIIHARVRCCVLCVVVCCVLCGRVGRCERGVVVRLGFEFSCSRQ
jgi:hypothetical protein